MADRVLIMSANPGRIVGELRNDMPYPRERTSAEFTARREELMNKFEALVGDGANPEPPEQDHTEATSPEANTDRQVA